MNAVPGFDASRADPEEDPDIILSEDLESSADGGARAAPDPERRRPLILRSPIARKIITFNLLALAILVAGVLVLNPFRDVLVTQTQRMLVQEAQLIARIFEAELPAFGPVDMAQRDGIDPQAVVDGLRFPAGLEVYVFDTAEQLVARAEGRPEAGHVVPVVDEPLLTGLLSRAWELLSAPFRGEETAATPSGEGAARALLAEALGGRTVWRTGQTPAGDLIFTVAAPIMRGEAVAGVVALTTVAGEIDQVLRLEREQVLQMFLVAILVSVGLSLVLASTIANPLSELAAAAELGRRRGSSRLAGERVRIPDMSARPDEIGRLSKALRGLVAALYDRIDSNEQFAADVAHEIKNPLTSLRSAVETLRMTRDDDKRAKLLDVIEHDVRRLDRLVSDISNASRLDAELVKEEMKPFDLVQMLRNLIEFHRIEAEEKGIELIADLPEEPIIVHGLESRLAQVYVNLISNALSFCGYGDAIRVWAREKDGFALSFVEDTGPGIPEGALKKIFSRFYSERPGDDFGNHSGLGLAISKQIVEAHGGLIYAENVRPTDADKTSEPLGARFVVSLKV